MSGDLGLFGGNGADLMEGSVFSDLIIGGGLDDEVIKPTTRLAFYSVQGPDEDALPNNLIGGPNDGVFVASVDDPDGGIPASSLARARRCTSSSRAPSPLSVRSSRWPMDRCRS